MTPWYWAWESPRRTTCMSGGLTLGGEEAGLELGEGDGRGVEEDLAAVGDADGDHLVLGLAGGGAFLGEMDLEALEAGGGHDDEDEEEHEVQVDHGRDVDVVVRFALGVGFHGHGGF